MQKRLVTSCVLDASALLALLHQEPGEERVVEALASGAVMSAVNLSEVVAKLADIGMTEPDIRATVETLDIEVAEFDVSGAFATGMLRPPSRRAGLSLGDRACLALGQQRGLPVLTADTAWNSLSLGSEIEIVMLR